MKKLTDDNDFLKAHCEFWNEWFSKIDDLTEEERQYIQYRLSDIILCYLSSHNLITRM